MFRYLNARDQHKIESDKTGQSGFGMLTVHIYVQKEGHLVKHVQLSTIFKQRGNIFSMTTPGMVFW
jgi:hypothetical protein